MNRAFFRGLCVFVAAAAGPAAAAVVPVKPIATFETVLGSFQIELRDDVAPKTVENFLHYVRDGDYDNTFIHRSVSNFVIQGGGYRFGTTVEHIPVDGPVVNEFNLSNLRGTIAMAKQDGNPNSATSEWFVNTKDNVDLDTNNGGFTVFGSVIGGGMTVVDAIAQVPRFNAGGAFNNLPLRDYTPPQTVKAENLITVTKITVPSLWQNQTPNLRLDVDKSGLVVPLDALLIISELNAGRAAKLPLLADPVAGQTFRYYDVNGDGFLTNLDALLVINDLNARAQVGSAAGALGSLSAGDFPTLSVPEPATLWLALSAALGGLAACARRALRSRA